MSESNNNNSSTTVVLASASGQQSSVPAVRSLRRRLWQALKEEDAATAIRAYTCTRTDFDKWLAEEAAEEQQRLERMEEARLREKLLKRETRSFKKLGSFVSIAAKRSHGGANAATNLEGGSHRRTSASTRKATVLTDKKITTAPNPAVSTPEKKRISLSGDTSTSLLQLSMNPSEPFLLDDQKSPLASYDEPSPTPDRQHPTTPRRPQRTRSLVPRLAGFFVRRRNDAGSESGSDDGNDKNEVDETMTTPLHEACRIGCAALVNLMLANGGGDPNFRNGKSRTALHMAAGGLTLAEDLIFVKPKIAPSSSEQPINDSTDNNNDGIGIRAPAIINNTDENNNADALRQQSNVGAKRAARAMGRFFKDTLHNLGSSTTNKDKVVVSSSTETKFSEKFDMSFINRLQSDRMDTCSVILRWVHPDDGSSLACEGPSINAVDCHGRTALHYAAELGRAAICMAVLSTFGAILTIVDDNARTPCELAGEQSHKSLAAQLEARALLYRDPYEMDDDDFVTSGYEEEEYVEDMENRGAHTRMTLVPPFSWFETLTIEQVEKERCARISRIMRGIREAVLDYNEAKDMRELMYNHASDDEDSVDGSKKVASKSNNDAAPNSPLPHHDMDSKPEKLPGWHSSSSSAAAKAGGMSQDYSTQETSRSPSALALCVDSFQEAHAEQFLAFHAWNTEKAINAIDDDPTKAIREASIELPVSTNSKQRSQGQKVCLICCDEFANNSPQWRNLENCEHGFCVACLGDYMTDCAVSRSGLLITCPHHECSVPLSRNEIESLVPEPSVFKKLVAAANDHFVAVASDLKFCPHPGCSCFVKRVVPQFVKTGGVEEDILDYSGAICTAVSANELTASGGALTYEGVPDPNYSRSAVLVVPKKAHRFCFACCEKVHWPVPCEALKAWEKKVEEEVGAVQSNGGEPNSNQNFDDLAQKLWMKANTRPCPKCKVPIEKNDGCNHMSCSNPHCKHEFCWICRKDWKLHNTETGGFFRCNRWQGEDDHEYYDTSLSAEDRAPPPLPFELLNGDEDQARYGTAVHSARVAWKKSKEMSRFLHHYRRWNAHSDSIALEKKMEETVCTRLKPVVEAALEYMGDTNFNFRGKGLSFVFSAFTELLECRSLLKHSYAFAFYRYPLSLRRTRLAITRGREKQNFELYQSELEMMTEQLSDIVARSHLRATQTQITFLTTETSEKRRDFSNWMLSVLDDERKEQRKKVVERGEEERIQREGNEIPTVSSWLGTDLSNIRRIGMDDETPTHRALRTTLRDFLSHRDEETGYRGDFEDEYDTFRWTNWSCTACTYMNSGGTRCAMCGSMRMRLLEAI